MKIAVITTSRADWNALQPVARELQAQGAEVHVIAITDHAGMDVLRKETWPLITAGSPYMHAAPEALLERDAAFTGALSMLESVDDIVVLCGDRHETLVAAHAAVLAGIPVAHIAGGDVTTGSSDDKYRDAISMLADLHFPTHGAAAERLLKMGCGPNIYDYGSPAIDRLMRTPIMPRAEVCKALGLEDARPFILANWQPETPVDHGLPEMLQALASQPLPGVIVGVNPDPGASEAERQIAECLEPLPGWRRRANLSPDAYLNAMFHAHCLIGNSSSGFYEAPYYGTPVINIGERQRGRTQPRCMTWVPVVSTAEIAAALQDLDIPRRYDIQQLYGDGTAAPKIANAILTPGWQRWQR